MPYKPMLASHCTDTSKLRFPVLVSKKLDGIRATVQGGRLLSRSLKPIANTYVQTRFSGLPEGLDGELIVGEPCAPDAYRKTTSIVMSDDKPAGDVQFWIFDSFMVDTPFTTRNEIVKAAVARGFVGVRLVQQTLIQNTDELDAYEADALADGHEGVMVRSLDGPYKTGRSSEREAYLLKLKRFADTEAT